MERKIRIILTGATGFVGEGVLLTCLEDSRILEVLMINRRNYEGDWHPKLKEYVIPDFFNLDNIPDNLKDYDACFYCAGISSGGVKEADYLKVTYGTTLNFASKMLALNPDLVFCHISGNLADSSEKGRIMWARIKGKTENALMRLHFKQVYNFRPGFMEPEAMQKNVKPFYRLISKAYPVLSWLFPNQVSTIKQVGKALINSVLRGYHENVLEIKDIKLLAE